MEEQNRLVQKPRSGNATAARDAPQQVVATS